MPIPAKTSPVKPVTYRPASYKPVSGPASAKPAPVKSVHNKPSSRTTIPDHQPCENIPAMTDTAQQGRFNPRDAVVYALAFGMVDLTTLCCLHRTAPILLSQEITPGLAALVLLILVPGAFFATWQFLNNLRRIRPEQTEACFISATLGLTAYALAFSPFAVARGDGLGSEFVKRICWAFVAVIAGFISEMATSHCEKLITALQRI